MTRVARAIGSNVDVREVLYTKTHRAAMHSNTNKRDQVALRETLGIRAEILGRPPAEVILLDDLLTTGCSFMVCKAMLSEIWPEANISGIFIARRVPE
jgi:predicted amidophosphoribosyltransferase